ncbi:hypothetical protein DFH28DRAFT_1116783 [Melampsora americana]|nr:hypothetical protein DFH28DRAFT_1116783 [Melampsora americana]
MSTVQESSRDSRELFSDRCSQSNALEPRSRGISLSLGSELRAGDNGGVQELSGMQAESTKLQDSEAHTQEWSRSITDTGSKPQSKDDFTRTTWSDSQNSYQEAFPKNELISGWNFKRKRSARASPWPHSSWNGFENLSLEKQSKLARFGAKQKDSIILKPESKIQSNGINLKKEIINLYENQGPSPLQNHQNPITKPGYTLIQKTRNRKVCVISDHFKQLEDSISVKKKLRNYSRGFKAKVVKWHLDNRKRQEVTARKFKIPQSCVSNWLKDHELWNTEDQSE